MKRYIVLWLMGMGFFVGCATGRNEKAEGVVTVGKAYAVRKLVLPEQRAKPFPFSVKKAMYSRFAEKDLASAIVVSDYLEAIATTGRLPLRVREGFLNKQNGQWYLAELPPEVPYRQFCAGYPTVGARVYYIAKMR